VMAVPVTSESQFQHGPEVAMFQTPPQQVLAPFAPHYDAAADGNRFLVRTELRTGAARTITVVTNVQPQAAGR
jgi:hypothetical protein